jgi:GT2 family glycosyltransferase
VTPRREDAPPAVPVSVAISTLDRPEQLGRCLDSLIAGTTLPAEIVLVDQSPAQTARPAVEARTDKALIRYVADAGRGLGAGQNAAVRQTTQPVVAVLDDDCVADEHWLETVDRLCSGEAPLDLVGGRVLPLGEATDGGHPVASRTSTAARDFRGKALPWDVGSGNNFALTREWFDRIGGCDERLGPGSPGRGGVDMDLFYRLLRAGAIARYEPALVVYHERASRSERLARRVPYGHGMAAACAIWLRGGDLYALRVLAAWLALRSRLLASALRHRRWTSAWEELLVLAGTARGFVHGLRVAGGSGGSRA